MAFAWQIYTHLKLLWYIPSTNSIVLHRFCWYLHGFSPSFSPMKRSSWKMSDGSTWEILPTQGYVGLSPLAGCQSPPGLWTIFRIRESQPKPSFPLFLGGGQPKGYAMSSIVVVIEIQFVFTNDLLEPIGVAIFAAPFSWGDWANSNIRTCTYELFTNNQAWGCFRREYHNIS